MTSRQPYWCSNTLKQRPRYVGKSTKCFMMISPRILSLYEAVTRWWSLATFTPLGTSTSLSERRLLRLNTKGSLWLWSRPFWWTPCQLVDSFMWKKVPQSSHRVVVVQNSNSLSPIYTAVHSCYFLSRLVLLFTRNEKKTLVGSFPNFRFVEA